MILIGGKMALKHFIGANLVNVSLLCYALNGRYA